MLAKERQWTGVHLAFNQIAACARCRQENPDKKVAQQGQTLCWKEKILSWHPCRPCPTCSSQVTSTMAWTCGQPFSRRLFSDFSGAKLQFMDCPIDIVLVGAEPLDKTNLLFFAVWSAGRQSKSSKGRNHPCNLI